MSIDTNNVLSRLLINAKDGFVVYETGSRSYFSAHLDELHEAHVDEIAVGAHPYAAVSLHHVNAEMSAPPATAEALPADRDGISIVAVLADWMDWCDDVADTIDGEVLHHRTAGTVIDAMTRTWRVEDDAAWERFIVADRIEALNEAVAGLDSPSLARLVALARSMVAVQGMTKSGVSEWIAQA